jgi:hypothetical protein
MVDGLELRVTARPAYTAALTGITHGVSSGKLQECA